jgi:hypothetical protein
MWINFYCSGLNQQQTPFSHVTADHGGKGVGNHTEETIQTANTLCRIQRWPYASDFPCWLFGCCRGDILQQYSAGEIPALPSLALQSPTIQKVPPTILGHLLFCNRVLIRGLLW